MENSISWPKTIILVISILGLLITGYCYRKKIFKFLITTPDWISYWFFRILFNHTEAETIRLAISSKRPLRKYWYLNNIWTPIVILYLPYLLTLASADFHVITFSKSWVELTLTGSFSMIGINVMRTNLTLINESLKPKPEIDEGSFETMVKDAESIKSKLRSWIHLLTLLGTIAYFIQVGNLVDPKNPKITPYLAGAIIIFLLSIFFGRLISVVQTNFADNEEMVKIWAQRLVRQGQKEFNNLKQESQGSLL